MNNFRLAIIFAMSMGLFSRMSDGAVSSADTQYLDCGNMVGPPSGFTISLWANSANTGTTMLFASQFFFGTDSYFQLYNVATGLIGFRVETNYNNYIGRSTSSGAWPANTWTNIIGTWDGGSSASSISIYVNGIKVDSSDDNSGTFTGANTNAVNFEIGAQQNGQFTFVGSLDDVQVYGRALSSQEIKSIANSRLHGPFNTNLLVEYWPMDEGTPTSSIGSLLDVSGNRRNCTPHGPAYSASALNYP